MVQAASGGGARLEGGYIPGIRKPAGAVTTQDVPFEAGCNMVSIPLIPPDVRKTSLYANASSAAFAYVGSYQLRDTLANGVGYWIKFPGQNVATFSGKTIQV